MQTTYASGTPLHDMKIDIAPALVTPDVKGSYKKVWSGGVGGKQCALGNLTCLSRTICPANNIKGANVITQIAAPALLKIRSFGVDSWLWLKCWVSKSGRPAMSPPFSVVDLARGDPGEGDPIREFPAILVLTGPPVTYLDLTGGRRLTGGARCRPPRWEESLQNGRKVDAEAIGI